METRFTILLCELGIAITVQMVVLIGIFMAVRKTTDKMTSLAEEVQKRTLPLLDGANAFLQNTRPQVETIVANLSETSTMLKEQVTRIDETVTDTVDRARLQIVRADELVSRTMERVETTTDILHHSVISPVRQLAGLLQGLNSGMNVLFGKRRRPTGNGHGPVPRDEMFI